MQTKRCPKCGQERALAEFYRNRSSLDGVQAWCKECWDKYQVARRPAYRTRRAELAREKWRAEHPEFKEREQYRQELRTLWTQGLSRCARCGAVKPVADFKARKDRDSGVTPYCLPCTREMQRETDAKRDRTAYIKQRYAHNKEQLLGAMRDWRNALRTETLRHYGGICACCGESIPEFLCLDHINGGGTQHRKAIGKNGGTSFYSWLRKRGYPPGYRVLCHNCNLSLGFSGYCPHQKAREQAPSSDLT